ncbi:hypothetical protein [Natronosalvus halobius]|uniref:hypothetical protein n=1 Tax=Natronosalvus halobius TaxID=2953746 RepID=UPI0020A0881D|nr:hypothetical protein [Natronosalvus halobius]USZ73733.1 hypothetical protein NGM15_18525 [Natronosalvus halobius]
MDARPMVITAVVTVFLVSWVFLAPVLGLPFGLNAATGASMGDEGPVLNIWYDGEPEMGDVVIFEQNGQLSNDRVAHRVVDETEHGFVTKGDANPYTDQEVAGVDYVTSENMVGVVLIRMGVFEVLSPTAALLVVYGVLGVWQKRETEKAQN